MNKRNILAIDCGNSSVRVVLGQFDGSSFTTTLISQTAHREIQIAGVWHWDILFIFDQIKQGIKKAHTLCGRIDTAGISTWGIDHGLIGEGNLLMANPLCYRNVFGQEGLAPLSENERRFMFNKTGILCDKINSVFQILGYRNRYPHYWAGAKRLLLIPDLLNFFLTGEENTDASIASTTQLFDVVNNRYAAEIFDKFSIDPQLFPPLVEHGNARGTLRKEIADELGVNRFEIISVPAHDTAAAVTAIPVAAGEDMPLFVSSGTWSLVGVELAKPLVNDQVYAANLANEAGILGTITLLKNSAGLFIAQRLKKECDLSSGVKSWDEIVSAIDMTAENPGLIDPNAEDFFNPPSMREAIADYLVKHGDRKPASDAECFRVVYESLAASYLGVLDSIEAIVGKRYDTLHIIGGGSQNTLLNQITASTVAKTVIAGPVEATSLGVLGSQLLYDGSAAGLSDIRRILSASAQSSTYTPI